MTKTRATIDFLRARIEARAAGYPVAYTTDPAWLVDMAINRRAGWKDDPMLSRGSAMPLPDGRHPKRATGRVFMAAWRLSRTINSCPRVVLHVQSFEPELRRMVVERFSRNLEQNDAPPAWYCWWSQEVTDLNYALTSRRRLRRRLRRMSRARTFVLRRENR